MAKSGGGIAGKNVVRGPSRTGQPAREMRPKGVSRIGQHMGNHATGSGENLNRRSSRCGADRCSAFRWEMKRRRVPGKVLAAGGL